MGKNDNSPDKSSIDKFQLNLENNAYDFLEVSFEFFIKARETSNRKYWKHALLNLTFAIELMLKERLRREHYLFLYHSLDKFQDITRETRTVSWSRAIERLRLVLGDKFEDIDAGRLSLAQKIRNQILHFDVLLKFPSAYHDYANLMNFVGDFFLKELAKSEAESVWTKINIDPKSRDKIHDDLDMALLKKSFSLTKSLFQNTAWKK